MKKILVLGATSAIAMETQRCFVEEGASFYLAARDQEKLTAVAEDLKTRGARQVETAALDLADVGKHAKLLEEADKALGGIDIILLAYGVLPEQEAMEADTAAALESIRVNFNSAFSLLERSAALLEEQGSGQIAAISSVAGDRVRSSNYVYGAAKAALSGHLSGLRGRLAKYDIAVTTIKPGFVDTPMTEDMEKGGPLWASAEKVGSSICKAINKRRDVVYIPWFWRWIMFIIRHLPEFIFKRMRM
jgi:hypothetical protein